MAWTIEQDKKFNELIRERSRVELNPDSAKVWLLQESFIDTILKNITDEEKQLILDKLIADRRPVLEKAITEKQAEITVLNTKITEEDTLITQP